MNVLVACEFSGRVRDEFGKRGHYAVSCDWLSSETIGPHYQGWVENLLEKKPSWDLMIAFPPCTYLASSGARWNQKRKRLQADAIDFVKYLWNQSEIDKICIENPIGVLSTEFKKPSQYIQPWMFGHGETKKTCLWLKNLPILKPTNIVPGRKPRVHYESPGPDRWKNRSRTYPGIARAMAEQWG